MVNAEELVGSSNNPKGLGDPNDRTLRKVEVNVLIPKKVREKAKTEKCTSEVAAFHKCCTDNGFSMVISCHQTNKVMKECLARWFHDEGLIESCREEYLKERSHYRLTGEKHPMKRM